ncbi:MAG: MBL fold metallo-hydrolase [Candidatus Nanohaloarchaea archaeon]
MLEYNGFEIFWDGHASVRIVDEGFTVAVDPYSEVSPDFTADLVLLTHDEEGHYDRGKIRDVATGRTCVVAPSSMDSEDIPVDDVEYIREGEHLDVFGIEIEGVPMYNEEHPRGEGLGYRFVMRGNSFYIAGDTGLYREAIELENRVNVAFLPVDGVDTMDVEEAVKLGVKVKPDLVVPYHYGKPFFDSGSDTQAFKAELEDRSLRCEVIEPENTPK